MEMIAKLLIGVMACLHLYILWLEMFAWTTRGPKVFRNFPAPLFKDTKALAANQGLYNGFLAAGLIWSLCTNNVAWSHNVALFFLSCIAIAGIYGAATIQKSILFIQTVPAALAMLCILLQ